MLGLLPSVQIFNFLSQEVDRIVEHKMVLAFYA